MFSRIAVVALENATKVAWWILRLQHILVGENIQDPAIVAAIDSLVSDAETLKVIPLALCAIFVNRLSSAETIDSANSFVGSVERCFV